MNVMRRDELNQKVCGCLVGDGIAVAWNSSMGALKQLILVKTRR